MATFQIYKRNLPNLPIPNIFEYSISTYELTDDLTGVLNPDNITPVIGDKIIKRKGIEGEWLVTKKYFEDNFI